MELAEPLSAEGLTYLRALARRPNDRCLGADREKEKMSESMEKLEARVKSLEAAVGALVACLARVGVEGRVPSISDYEALVGLSDMMMMGEPGIPKNAAPVLRSYASQIADAEGWGESR